MSSSSLHSDDNDKPTPRAIRLRRARAGHWFIDRCVPASRLTSISNLLAAFMFHRHLHEEEDPDDERHKEERLTESWKFDEDKYSAVGPEGPDEQDCVFLDDYESRFLQHSITLLPEKDQDQHTLVMGNSLTVTGPDGHMQQIILYHLGLQQHMLRRDAQLMQRSIGVHPGQIGVPMNERYADFGADADEEDACGSFTVTDIKRWNATACNSCRPQHPIVNTIISSAGATTTSHAANQWHHRHKSKSHPSC
jgi:hypothetical protein